MLRVTDELVEVRRWAEARGARPFRHADGGLALEQGEPDAAVAVDWGEFESAFRLGRSVAVFDEAPGSCTSYVGTKEEARAYVARAAPHASGASGRTP